MKEYVPLGRGRKNLMIPSDGVIRTMFSNFRVQAGAIPSYPQKAGCGVTIEALGMRCYPTLATEKNRKDGAGEGGCNCRGYGGVVVTEALGLW
jgi:hypothetical protein